MQAHAAITMHDQHLVALEVVLGVLLVEIPDDRVTRLAAVGQHERQLQRLDTRKLACRIGRRRPDNVGYAITRHVGQLGRRPAELHRRIELALDAIVGLLTQLLAPRFNDVGLGV
ncbi:hypothetical protein D3C79_727830 [compost metagenome]